MFIFLALGNNHDFNKNIYMNGISKKWKIRNSAWPKIERREESNNKN